MILIVESGSTKTAWRLIKDPASAYESFSSPGINPYYQNTDEITAAQASVLAGFTGLPIQAIYYYGTGVTGEAQCEVIAAAFRPYFPNTCSLEIQNDLIAAARSLCGKEAGIACMAFFTVHGYHGIKSRSIGKTKFSGILNSSIQVFVSVNKQISRYFWICSGLIKW